MFRSKPNNTTPPQCKKHPKHRQSPGVCSVCLTEKLSKLPATSSNIPATAPRLPSCPSSSSSSLYSSDISSCESPQYHDMPPHYRGYPYRRFASDLRTRHPAIDVLNKSRSMAIVSSQGGGGGGGGEIKDHGKKKSGFWLKWLKPRRKRNDPHHHQVFMHSQPLTIREKTSGKRAC
ncbi:hypothetical protein Ancab_038388 [Ancistrocladus abbreviatus]